jgi:dienelactone hydrolase
MKDRVTINGHDGTFGAYIARPEALPAPAVVVLQELFGVNADIREKCDELAEQGFLAVAPGRRRHRDEDARVHRQDCRTWLLPRGADDFLDGRALPR